MEKIEISTPEPDRVLPVLQDAVERQNASFPRVLLARRTEFGKWPLTFK